MLMVLENDTMNLIDPLGQTLLHAQPIGSIRVWGVGRDNGRSVSERSGPKLGRGSNPVSLVSATKEVTDGILLLIGVVLNRCAYSDWCVALFLSFFLSFCLSFFLSCVTQRFGILWCLS